MQNEEKTENPTFLNYLQVVLHFQWVAKLILNLLISLMQIVD